MATAVQFHGYVKSMGEVELAPELFDRAASYPIFTVSTLIIPAGTTRQIVGGTSPVFAHITTISFLAIQPADVLTLGLQSVAIGSGIPLAGAALFLLTDTTLTEMRLRNAGTVNTDVTVYMGGSA